MIISKPSPNYWKGRNKKISKIVIHHTAGEFTPSVAHLRNPKSEVSAHYIISRDGKTIYRLVGEGNTAWHARQANPFSIGIEHTSTYKNPFKGYPEAAKLVADICKRHNLNPRKAVEPHSKYVATRCPDSLNWKKIRDDAYIIWKGEDMYRKKDARGWFNVALKYDKRIKEFQKLIPQLRKQISEQAKVIEELRKGEKASKVRITALEDNIKGYEARIKELEKDTEKPLPEIPEKENIWHSLVEFLNLFRSKK